MDVDFKNKDLPKDVELKLRKELGFAEDPIPFDEEKIKAALSHPEVEQVRVFNLEKGMTVNVGGHKYKVTAVRPNGKITIRKLKV